MLLFVPLKGGDAFLAQSDDLSPAALGDRELVDLSFLPRCVK